MRKDIKIKPRVSLLIINQDREILLIKRRKEKRVYWVFPGGGVEAGETLIKAAQREALEETSLVLESLLPTFSVLNRGRKEHFFLSYVGNVCAKLGDGPERKIQSGDNVYDLKWVKMCHLHEYDIYPIEGKKSVLAILSERKL